jgi:pteridine reductase
VAVVDDSMPLTGTVALVTGGARRVGRAIVLALAEAGCDVAVHYRSSHTEAHALVEQITTRGRKGVAVQGDLNDRCVWPEVISETVGRLDRLDVLINNASVFDAESPVGAAPSEDTVEGFRPDYWESVLRTNLIAPMALCHHAHPHLKKTGKGKIINLCDIAADHPWRHHLAYCASKSALATLTRALARALAPEIQVNAVAPGIAMFPEEYSEDLRNRLIKRVPLGRAGTPREVAQLVRFLVESGGYMTGQIISIDGGRSLA